MDDQDIIKLFFKRKESAIVETDSKYGGNLLRLAMNILKCHEDAEECKNDTYFETWNTIPPNCPIHFFAYLMRICRCNAFDRIDGKKAKKRSGIIVELTQEMLETISDTRIQTDIEEWEMGEIISDFLNSLTQEKRVIFMRRYWYGESIREISLKYGMAESKVKTQLYRTRESLKNYLRKEGIYCV